MEAQRIRQRVEYDLEMIKELGYCSGIENYSRYFDGRMPGARPFCLLDYFPDDYLMIVDESHVTLPQVRGMYGGDSARKENLVEYGFRLPAARDNRPLRFEEFEQLQGSTIYVSATPSNYELSKSETNVVEQFIRPTGIIDPPLSVRISGNHISDLLEDIDKCVARNERMIVTTITKRLAEDMAQYLEKIGIRSRYIHSDLDTLERVQILEDLRNGLFDVLVGVNLLREGIDLPEVSHIAIFDADKEGILRNARSLIQMAGRAARHANGKVVLYGTRFSDSMRMAIEESNRHRLHQIRYNAEHGIMPKQIKRNTPAPNMLIANSEEAAPTENIFIAKESILIAADTSASYNAEAENLDTLIARARGNMEAAAKVLDFTAAKRYRDEMYRLERLKGEATINS